METTTEVRDFSEPGPYFERLEALLDEAELRPELRGVAHEALNWYSEDLPYHNLEHMFEVTHNTLSLCEQNGVTGMAKEALILAALWHDAAYPIPLEDYFESKEHRSASLAQQAILELRDGQNLETQIDTLMLADFVATLIISTHAERSPTDLYEQILNQADTANIGSDTVEMLRRSAAFYIEGRMLAGEEFVGTIEQFLYDRIEDFTVWCQSTQGVLTALTEKKLGSLNLIEAVRNNIAKITPTGIIDAIRNKN